MKKIAKVGAVLVGAMTVVGLAVPVFAMENGDKSGAPEVKHTKAAAAFDATKVGCVGTAVGKREDAVDAAFSAFNSSESSALSTRKTDLTNAYANSKDSASLKSAIKDAWKAFRDSKATARKTFWDARTAAWSTFKTDVKACGMPAMDSADNSNEISK